MPVCYDKPDDGDPPEKANARAVIERAGNYMEDIGASRDLETFLLERVPAGSSVTIRRSSFKGFGLFATKDLMPGCLVLSERPLFTVSKDQCTESGIQVAYDQLSRSEQELFDFLARPFPDKLHTFLYHMFDILGPPKTSGAVGFCVLAAKINHSCCPNVASTSTGSEVAPHIRALSEIKAGQELMFNYLPSTSFLAVKERRAAISALCLFHCRCRVCESGDKASDMRRSLASALVWLANPKLADSMLSTVEGRYHLSGRVLVSDSRLVNDRLHNRISVSAILRFAKLAALLLEADGIRGLINAQVLSEANELYLETELRNSSSTNVEATTGAIIDQAHCLEMLEASCEFEHVMTGSMLIIFDKLVQLWSRQADYLTEREKQRVLQRFPQWCSSMTWMAGYRIRYFNSDLAKKPPVVSSCMQ